VNEDIVRAAIGSDKSEALVLIEPLNGSLRHTLQLSSSYGCRRTSHASLSR
jgi:hypothetical protein